MYQFFISIIIYIFIYKYGPIGPIEKASIVAGSRGLCRWLICEPNIIDGHVTNIPRWPVLKLYPLVEMKSIVLYTCKDRPSIILYMIYRIGPCPIKYSSWPSITCNIIPCIL